MRFMMIVKATKESEAGRPPTREVIQAMGKYNEELLKAGALLAGEGLHPTSKGFRVRFSKDAPRVIDGPFSETKELVAGFWIIQVASREEAIKWASRVPFPEGSELEVRQVFETEDFPADVLPPEEAKREQEMRDALQRKAAAGRA